MEFVFVVPREELFRGDLPQGWKPFESAQEQLEFLDVVERTGFFVERDYAEKTPRLKQIIPYTVLWSAGSVLLMRRLSKGGEQRLHDKLSIGVGGHINPEDLGTSDHRGELLERAARREIAEELEVRGAYETHPIGLLNDDSNPVGAVHLGWVQLAIASGSVRIREEDTLEGRLVGAEELRQRLERAENFETWSSLLIADLDRLVQHTPTATLR